MLQPMKTSTFLILALFAGFASIFIFQGKIPKIETDSTQTGSISDNILESATSSNEIQDGDFVSDSIEVAATSQMEKSIENDKNDFSKMFKTTIVAPKGNILAYVASNSEQKRLGLSNIPVLADNAGMLFIFDSPTTQAFWMKDMRFGIDIVWIDKDFKVVGVLENISPDSYPATFVSPVPISYVLEINSGKADYFGLDIGSTIKY